MMNSSQGQTTWQTKEWRKSKTRNSGQSQCVNGWMDGWMDILLD